MTLEYEIPLVPTSAPANLRPVFDGAYDEKCSVLHFRDYLPDSFGCEEISSKRNWDRCLRAFWYPEKAPSGSQPPVDSIQRKIKSFLFSLEDSMPSYSTFVQFWAPITTEDGKRTLSVSRQPFAAGVNRRGLCRYRYYCQELCRLYNGSEVDPYFGPVGRAFTKGSLEFSPRVGNYYEEDFPLKNHAEHCGFKGYMALPLFELVSYDADGQQPSCVGVLEFVSFNIYAISSFDTAICINKLKEVGLTFRYPAHSEALTNKRGDTIWLEHSIRPYFNFPPPQNARKANRDELRSSLDFVIEKYSLPLVQIWLPCICNGSVVSVELEPNSDSFSKVTHLVCGLQCVDLNDRQSVWLSSYACCDSLVYFIEDGESWVGRAHLLKKICFIKDIRQYSIADYPFATLGRHSSDLSACFAVPLQLVNPKLPPLVLEVFLPTQYSFDADQGAILKRILSTFAQELSKYNADFGLRKDEEYFIEISHSEDDYDCVFLDMYHGPPVVEEEHESHQSNDIEIEELQAPKRENTSPYLLPCNGNIVVGGQYTPPKNEVLNVQQIPGFPTISVDSSGKEATNGPRNVVVDNGNGNGTSTMPENGKCESIVRGKDAVDDSCTMMFIISEIKELQVPTGENTRPHLLPCIETIGSRSTLKRKCPSSNEMRPTRPRNDVLHAQQMPELPTISVDISDDEDRQSSSGKSKEEPATNPIPLPANGKEKTFGHRNGDFDIDASVPTNEKDTSTMPENRKCGSIERGKDAIGDSCTLIVRARHNDDFVRFPFSSNSGIEGLRGDVLKRFELKDGSFKIKYQDDGYWIMLSCSEDLSFYMRSLKSSEQTTMDLSVFTTT